VKENVWKKSGNVELWKESGNGGRERDSEEQRREGASSLTTKNYNVFPRREHSYVLQHPASTASSFQTTTSNEILNVRILPTEANIGHRR